MAIQVPLQMLDQQATELGGEVINSTTDVPGGVLPLGHLPEWPGQ